MFRKHLLRAWTGWMDVAGSVLETVTTCLTTRCHNGEWIKVTGCFGQTTRPYILEDQNLRLDFPIGGKYVQ
jgi:hypothetical protein